MSDEINGSVNRVWLRGFLRGVDCRPVHFRDALGATVVCNLCGLVARRMASLPCSHVFCDFCFWDCTSDDPGAQVRCIFDRSTLDVENVRWNETRPLDLVNAKEVWTTRCETPDRTCNLSLVLLEEGTALSVYAAADQCVDVFNPWTLRSVAFTSPRRLFPPGRLKLLTPTWLVSRQSRASLLDQGFERFRSRPLEEILRSCFFFGRDDEVVVLTVKLVSAFVPSISSCFSFYGRRHIWAAPIVVGGICKMTVNYCIWSFYAQNGANVPADKVLLLQWTRWIPFVGSVFEVILAGLPCLPAEGHPVAHAATVLVTAVWATAGALYNLAAMSWFLGAFQPVRSNFH
ncbi:hypothetical protein HPB52_008642 [Rhipicephalus sanguineus]|uniref:RING-type domain-containing protein n=1 Tax=Rhipicephalus sanguineus TaxID=34632 RepID=A0A9D4QDT7_RHISA|nr:hypothetical protein HPB52_008642 [Rhipicephalus sanguineus]